MQPKPKPAIDDGHRRVENNHINRIYEKPILTAIGTFLQFKRCRKLNSQANTGCPLCQIRSASEHMHRKPAFPPPYRLNRSSELAPKLTQISTALYQLQALHSGLFIPSILKDRSHRAFRANRRPVAGSNPLSAAQYSPFATK